MTKANLYKHQTANTPLGPLKVRSYFAWYPNGTARQTYLAEPQKIKTPTGVSTAETTIYWHENGALKTCISFKKKTLSMEKPIRMRTNTAGTGTVISWTRKC